MGIVPALTETEGTYAWIEGAASCGRLPSRGASGRVVLNGSDVTDLGVADRVGLMSLGRITWMGSTEDAAGDLLASAYLS